MGISHSSFAISISFPIYFEAWLWRDKFCACAQAVEFVNMQHDDELWEELIRQCLNKPEMVCFRPTSG